MKDSNLIIALLQALRVKHTTMNAMKMYREHPHRYDLYGLSSILNKYGVENVGIRVDDKAQIREMETPFIAHVSNDFVLVKELKDENIEYLWHDKWIIVSIDNFLKGWSGVVLLPEVNESSIEPNYEKNRKREWIENALYGIFWLALGIVVVLLFAASGLWQSWSRWILILSLLGGIGICCLLLQKQMKIESSYADKLCSLFKKSDCNNVLESDASKLWDIFSWNEIGFGYFFSTLLIVLLFPQWIVYCAWVQLFVLPYSIWSIWYQRFRVKQWCPLCLIVMGNFWLLFFIYLFSDSYHDFIFDWKAFGWISSLYTLPFLTLHFVLPVWGEARTKEQLVFEMNYLKFNEDVFTAILKRNSAYEVSLNSSQIILGNPDAKTCITILTNPHCGPCAKMHTRIENLLHKAGDRYYVQYIFSSFDETLEISNKMLIALYLKEGKEQVESLYHRWFENGKYRKEEFFEQNKPLITAAVEIEFEKHQVWKAKTKLQATPTILVNGYPLPEQYKIEDLIEIKL